MQNLTLGRAFMLCAVPFAAVLAAASLASLGGAFAAGLEPETVLYSFCAKGGKTCTDGTEPVAALVRDTAGHLYGTTPGGGAHGGGEVFALIPNAARTKWTETVLYSFCMRGGLGCTDGYEPLAGLVMDKAGDLYGTTTGGGAHGGGEVFALIPNAARTKWTETVLYSFGSHSSDGNDPYGQLAMDAAGDLYGATVSGGSGKTGGTVFELKPNSAKTKWTETVLHSFGASTADGTSPYGGVIIDAAGDLYGTTLDVDLGATYGGGTVFELIPNAAKTKWTEKVLHTFLVGTNFADGSGSYAGLIIDRTGRLYGTTASGGAHEGGTVFELTSNAAKTKWTETVLYSFCARSKCADGDQPYTGLIIDSKGDLYGTATQGGSKDMGGTVFELSPNSAKTKWTETVLYDFCARSASGQRCADGDGPYAGLIMDALGHLYGTTEFGGAYPGPYGVGAGTVFELP
ncbi:MAG: choice-of-anchor tandem repeat GloVer-containing protein [Stellaceae bacterium]